MTRVLIALLVICVLNLPNAALAQVQKVRQSDADKAFQRWISGNSSWGQTGLLEMPNARVMEDWSLRATYGYSDPFVYHAFTFTALPRLELNAKITRVIGEDPRLGNSGSQSDFGDYKDKSVDLKFQLLKEGTYTPAIAIGAQDIHGTGLFTSRYLAASKFFMFMDFTLGLGQGRLGGEPIATSSATGREAESFIFGTEKDFRPFGGVDFRFNDNLSFMIEYDPIKYEKDRISPINVEPRSPINYGFRYQTPWHLDLTLSRLRGDEWGGGISATLPLEPYDRVEPPYKASKFMRKRMSRIKDQGKLAKKIHTKLSDRGFPQNKVTLGDDYIWVEIKNKKYLSRTKAIGRAARIAHELAPKRITTIYVSLRRYNASPTTLAFSRSHWQHYLENEISMDTLRRTLKYSQHAAELEKSLKKNTKRWNTEGTRASKLSYGIRPKLQTFFNDASGFASGRVSLLGSVGYRPWEYGQFIANARLAIASNARQTKSPNGLEPVSVRSDVGRYLDRTPVIRMEQLGYDQIFRLPHNVFFRTSAGLFDYGLGGATVETLKYFYQGRLAIGFERSKVRKRDPDSSFEFYKGKEYNFYSRFLTLYYTPFPKSGIETTLNYGRFLGGDEGWRIAVSRTYRHFSMGAWYTLTNSGDAFLNGDNKDYRDVGVFVRFPFRLFPHIKSNKRGSYGISAWTRDVGAMPGHLRTIYGATRDDQPYFTDLHLSELND